MFINLITGGNGGGATAGVTSLNEQTGDLKLKTVNNNDLLGEGNIEIQAEVTSVNGQKGDVVIDVPTKVSQLENDATYQTKEQVAVSITEAMSGATGGGMEPVYVATLTQAERKDFYDYFTSNVDETGRYYGKKWPYYVFFSQVIPASAIISRPSENYIDIHFFITSYSQYRTLNINSDGSKGEGLGDIGYADNSAGIIFLSRTENFYLDNRDTNRVFEFKIPFFRKITLNEAVNNNFPCFIKFTDYSNPLVQYILPVQIRKYGSYYLTFEVKGYQYEYEVSTSNNQVALTFVSKTPLPNINSSEVSNIKILTQAEYDAIDPKDEKTLYMIKG